MHPATLFCPASRPPSSSAAPVVASKQAEFIYLPVTHSVFSPSFNFSNLLQSFSPLPTHLSKNFHHNLNTV